MPKKKLTKKDEQNWAVGLHLSTLAGSIVPLAGWVAPVVIWLAKREESAILDTQGKRVINMLLTLLIAYTISGLLCLVLIGFPLLGLVWLYSIAMPIYVAVKASEGNYIGYPYTIQFLK